MIGQRKDYYKGRGGNVYGSFADDGTLFADQG